MDNNLAGKIEAILFASGDPISITRIAKICDTSVSNIQSALSKLKNELNNRGINLIFSDKEASLATAPLFEENIKSLHEDEINRPLGKAGIETLSIILYQGPVTKPDIDHIRGVNSATILRNLMIRGLVNRKENPKNKRSFVYETSMDTLRYLGISSIKDLPNYEKTKEALKNGVSTEEN